MKTSLYYSNTVKSYVICIQKVLGQNIYEHINCEHIEMSFHVSSNKLQESFKVCLPISHDYWLIKDVLMYIFWIYSGYRIHV